MPVFEYTVDDEQQTTSEHELTARQILQHAGIDPASYYLVQLHGQKQDAYKDRPDEPIHMHQHMQFVSVFTGPTTVS